MLEYKYIIIGGGIAGVSCVEKILELESEARILLISNSSVVKEVSNVTSFGKTLNDFIVVEKALKSFQDVRDSVNIIQGKVISINNDHQILITADGKEFQYEKLCICSGAFPKIPFTIDPKCEDKVVGIRDTDSVEELSSKISKASRIVIIGNGGIATELVYELDGVEIIWVVKHKSISANYIDAGAAEFFLHAKDVKQPKSNVCSRPSKRKRYSELQADSKSESHKYGTALGPDWQSDIFLKGLKDEKNIVIEYEAKCESLLSYESYKESPHFDKTNNKWPIYCSLKNGKFYGCDLVICGTGVIPNSDVFPGDKDENGIQVKPSMSTSIKNVFAAGDCAYPNWKWPKHWFQMRLWSQARLMGLQAGKSMATLNSNENEEELDFSFELFSHVTKFFGFKVVLLGLYNGQGIEKDHQHLLVRCTKNVEYIKVVLVDWKMQGAILIGDTGLEETFENLILNQLDLSLIGEELLNPDVDIEDYFD